MDTQRLIAFVVFSFSLLLLWEAWQDYNRPKTETHAIQSGQQAGAPAPADTAAALPKPGAGLRPASPQTGKLDQGERLVVKTDVLTAVIDTHGGDIRQLTLDGYRQNEDKTKPYQLFEERGGRNYLAQSGFIGQGLPSHKTLYELPSGDYTLKPGQDEIRLSMKAVSENAQVVKTYVFRRGSYVVQVRHEVTNTGQSPLEGYPYYQLVRHGEAPEGESAFVHTFTGPVVYTEVGKYQKVSFEDIAKGKQEHVKEAQDGWIGLAQHHFVAVWLTRDPQDTSKREFYTRDLGNGEYAAGMILPAVQVAPGESREIGVRLYAGPQELEKIQSLAPGMEYVVDYGWLHVLAYPLFWLLNQLNKLVDNWGVAIILLTVIIKLVFYPLSAASYKSMAHMRKLAPRLQQLKETYGDDRQKLHENMMKIYQEEKINPLGGCLPILVQIPVFIALYWVLLGAVELRQAPFAFWITDLSAKDPYYILPLVMAATMFIQMKLSPTPPDPVQAKVMMAMPIVFSVFFFFFPAGLVLYWLVNNVLSILQQWRITQVIERAGHGKAAKK
ncbi:MAG: membrane protein insertase YidC [Thiobacillaceae bacterium]|jgi:YidC/Oxa1 family membrane protein insertase|nr:membrane protein insertase YidC [Thiobacillaceae bacterium]